MVRHSTDVSILGPSTRVTGRVSGEGGLRVEGNLRGDVQVTGSAEIAEGGSVVFETAVGVEPELPLPVRSTRRHGSTQLTVFDAP